MADRQKEVLMHLAKTGKWLKIGQIAASLGIGRGEVHVVLANAWRNGGLIEDRNLEGRTYGTKTEFKITAAGRAWLEANQR